MMTFNGVSPTLINYNGNSNVNVFVYNGTVVWGKPFSLNITQGLNTSVSVNRTSSPNEHASTGTLPNGSLIYYGDVLTITADASSGYNLTTFTVNGTDWISGSSITVYSAITIVTGATASQSWKTVWTGYNGGNTTSNSYQEKVLSLTSSVVANRPTKISGESFEDKTVFTDVELISSPTAVVNDVGYTQYAYPITTLGNITIRIRGKSSLFSTERCGLYITEIKQYF